MIKVGGGPVGGMRLLVVVTRRTRRLASYWAHHLRKVPLDSHL